jgi:hypothetical protein
MSTYCQICGLPVQFDHYVPIEGGMLYIWRGEGADEYGPAIAFGPEHAWLRRAVALRLESGEPIVPAFAGVVHDGVLEVAEECYVMEGIYDRAALHDTCWALADRPLSFQALEHLDLPEADAPYRQQLFDFQAFVADGHGWKLVDPDEDSPDGRLSRGRIVALLR